MSKKHCNVFVLVNTRLNPYCVHFNFCFILLDLMFILLDLMAHVRVTGEKMLNTFCPGRGSNQDLLRGSQTLYCVAIKAKNNR